MTERLPPYLRSRWKNGLGATEQIAIHPKTADLGRGDFDWRISTAVIERSSDFSLFPEHDRVLLAFSPLRLIHPDGRVELKPLEPYAFSGARATRAELLTEAPVRDLGVLFRRGRVKAGIHVGAKRADGDWNFIFAAGGALTLAKLTLSAGETARVDRGPLELSGPGIALLISIHRTP